MYDGMLTGNFYVLCIIKYFRIKNKIEKNIEYKHLHPKLSSWQKGINWIEITYRLPNIKDFKNTLYSFLSIDQ